MKETRRKARPAMPQTDILPADLRLLAEHIYQYKKGVRRLVLHTFHRRHEAEALRKLESQGIDYHLQPLDNGRANLFFGHPACMETVRHLMRRPLYALSPEEDFILGTLLGYDVSQQCLRYCQRKKRCASSLA